MAQKPDLVMTTDILGHPIVEMCMKHKLYEGHHFKDIHSGNYIGKMKEKVP